MMQTMLEVLRQIIEPQIESLGYELVYIDLAHQDREQILCVYIDAPGGIMVDDCAVVSEQLSLVLDIEDPLSTSYLLEVSSPGLNRPLVKPAHFAQFLGHKARIIMANHVMGRKRFKGTLQQLDTDVIVIEVDGERYDLPFDQISSARLEPEF